MKQKTFSLIAGIIFLLVAFVHIFRLLFGWQVQINEVPIPYSFSWLGVTIALALAFFGIRLSRKN